MTTLQGTKNGYELRVYGILLEGVALTVLKFTEGTSSLPGGLPTGSNHASSYGYESLEPVHVGVEVDRDSGFTKVYLVKESDTAVDADLWKASNVRFTFTDTDHMTRTKCGLLTWNSQRLIADKIELRDNTNRVFIDDELRVSVYGQLRTITPLTP